VNGCINFNHTKIYVDLTNTTSTKLILNSTSGCLQLSSNQIIYSNEPKCITLKSEENSYSLIVVFQTNTDCGAKQESQISITWWEITLIIVVAGLVLIFVAIILLVPSIRSKIFSKQKV